MRRTWEDYFKANDLLRLLCRWRARLALKRSPIQRLSALVDDGVNPVEKCPDLLAGYLPSRRKWMRMGTRERNRIGEARGTEVTIFRSALRDLSRLAFKRPEWVSRFEELYAEVLKLKSAETIVLNPPTIHLVVKSGGSERRCLASYEHLVDRLLLSRAAVYLREVFDPLMDDSSFAFRKDRSYSYKSAIDELLRYRKRYAGRKLYVAECDIQSFFDVVNHNVVMTAYDGFVQQLEVDDRPDPQLRKILAGYLDSFTSRGNLEASTDPKIVDYRHLVKPLEKTSVGRFYPKQKLSDIRLGIPQGGALSPLLANLVLHSADRAVKSVDDPELLYLRFCDDIIIVHPDKSACRDALQRYMSALEMLKLPVHELKRRVPDGEDYYLAKSKGPFLWAEKNLRQKSARSWVSFLGVHIRHDGEVRVRLESLEKHETKLKLELKRYREAIGKKGCKLKDSTPDGRESILRAFESRIVAMGVGYSTMSDSRIGNRCWAGAFPTLSAHGPVGAQLKYLDSVRGHLVASLRKALGLAPGKLPSGNTAYYGRPYSYYGILTNVERHSSYPPLSAGESYSMM